MNDWFVVDRGGLAEVAKRRGMHFVVTEPIQNAWDEPGVSFVTVNLTPVPNSPQATISVIDDAPNGFRDITDSYSMFRRSYKTENPEQRGRFNVGEKLLLAMALDARVVSTTGGMEFLRDGSRRRIRSKTPSGSMLTATLRMTREELERAVAFCRMLIPPGKIVTTINGSPLIPREPVLVFRRSLETEVSSEEGIFGFAWRSTEIRVHEPLDGETPRIYEMGIPIDTVDCPWHVEVMQKVPLSLDRSSVRSGFARDLVVAVTEAMAERLTDEQARQPFAALTIEQTDNPGVVRSIVRKRFGTRAVSFDPSDPEASKRATDKGYAVVHGGAMSKRAWSAVRTAGALVPAGKKFSTKVEARPDGKRPLPPESLTWKMRAVAGFTLAAADHVLKENESARLEVNFYALDGNPIAAFCGGGEVGFNVSGSGGELIERFDSKQIYALVIHELAHVRVSDHLCDAYHTECCRIGAALLDGFYKTLSAFIDTRD